MVHYKLVTVAFLLISSIALSQQKVNKRLSDADKDNDYREKAVFNTNIPKHNYDIVLERPTNNSVTISILTYHSAEAYVAYIAPGESFVNTEKISLQENEPSEIVLNNLKKNTKYRYLLYYKTAGAYAFTASQTFHFQTQRSTKEAFTFTVTADSHLDQNADTTIYKTTLLSALADSADFHIDLGDTFMTDKYRKNYKEAFNQYLAQRYYFGLLCHSSPLFFVLGNHDGESGQKLNDKSDNMTVWSNQTRKKYFLNPVPNGFYKGNANEESFVDLLQNYYAWEWGNALFVVLDPFWYTPRDGADDPWERTLGKKQYDWLKTTLEISKAKFKFVFIHNLVGGVDIKGKARGGAEVAGLYEWGGRNPDGTNGFKEHRPEWEMPIHDLLVKNKVSAVFHGHDHLYAKQDLDNIVYQCLPQPGSKDFGNTRQAAEYGYVNGVIMNGPGYMRINVSEQTVSTEYVSTNPSSPLKNRKVVHIYNIKH